ETAAARDLVRTPRHPYTRGLMAAVPGADTPRGKLAAIRGTVPELVDPPAACRFSGRCPHETGTCRSNDPVLEAIAPGHSVACFIDHPVPSGEGPTYDRVTT
ncbi:MAG: methionine ABC transporter ATP-binding protein, partial [Boseongicola sp.]|nr:methionine ABC transporter ATP-binding protein [Boseongicola sp.]